MDGSWCAGMPVPATVPAITNQCVDGELGQHALRGLHNHQRTGAPLGAARSLAHAAVAR